MKQALCFKHTNVRLRYLKLRWVTFIVPFSRPSNNSSLLAKYEYVNLFSVDVHEKLVR